MKKQTYRWLKTDDFPKAKLLIVLSTLLPLFMPALFFNARHLAHSETVTGWVQTDGKWKSVRPAFYHKAQGSRLIPMSLFLALEQKNSPTKFTDPTFLNSFGFLQDKTADHNPDSLPVGFTRTKTQGQPDYLGFNCAFCHTGQIHYTDPNTYLKYSIRVDGGPSMQFNARFLKELLEAFKTTLDDPGKKDRFVKAVTQQQDPFFNTPDEIEKAVRKMLSDFNSRTRLDSLEWGFGRFDALGNGGNHIFAVMYPNIQDNMRVANGPVSIPSIWGTTSFDKMQWNGTVRNFLARSIAETWSAGGSKELDLSALQWMEEAVGKIAAPPWPEFFPPIDYKKKEAGELLYKDKCEKCHGMSGTSPVAISLRQIGTDATAANNYTNRKVSTTDGRRISAAQAMEELTQQEIVRGLSTRTISHAGENENKWGQEARYIARPLDGIWASPPYLHNGSVPNIYQLLSPVRERSKCFYVDNGEYDPVRLGFVLRRCDFQSRLDDPSTGFELDTSRPGNYNWGHEFANVDQKGNALKPEQCMALRAKARTDEGENGLLGCELADHERWQLIEYLKSLPKPLSSKS